MKHCNKVLIERKEGESDHPANITPPPPIKITQIFKPDLGFPQESPWPAQKTEYDILHIDEW